MMTLSNPAAPDPMTTCTSHRMQNAPTSYDGGTEKAYDMVNMILLILLILIDGMACFHDGRYNGTAIRDMCRWMTTVPQWFNP